MCVCVSVYVRVRAVWRRTSDLIQLCDLGTSIFAFQGPLCWEIPGQSDLSLHQFHLVRDLWIPNIPCWFLLFDSTHKLTWWFKRKTTEMMNEKPESWVWCWYNHAVLECGVCAAALCAFCCIKSVWQTSVQLSWVLQLCVQLHLLFSVCQYWLLSSLFVYLSGI